MIIGFDAKRAFLNSSGLGNYSRNTLNALYDYFPENKYVLFTPEIKEDLFHQYNRFDVISPDSSAGKIFRSLWRSFSLSGQLKKHELDCFHGLSNELPDGIHKTDVPSVVTIHDLIFLRYPQFYKPVDRKIYYAKVKYACKSATKIIAISEQTKSDIIEYFKVNPEKIELVNQSISPRFFSKQEHDIHSKYELSNEYILCVGTLEPRKNQLAILKAVREKKIGTQVVFIGRPTDYSAEIFKYVSINKMENQVKLLNNMPRKDLAAVFQNAKLSVYISLFEGFGLPVIESMACGCPVITSNVSCLPETAGGAAVLSSPDDIDELGDNIKNVLENDSLRNVLIKKGLERARLFHPEYFSQKMISLYKKLIE